MKRKSCNIVNDLCLREYSVKSYLRQNAKIIRKMICQSSARFKKVWQKNSNQPISYENGRLYYNAFRTCIHCCGYGNLPQRLYTLPPSAHKIEDCLSCMCPLDCIPEEHKGYRPHLLALTAHNWLLRYDLDTGQLLEEIFLTPVSHYKFRHLAWDVEEHSFVIKSVQCRPHSSTQRVRDVLMCLAVFSNFPLKFNGMFEITRSVFGSDLTDAMISQGCLITMHQKNIVRIFSMEQIFEQGQMYEAHLYHPCKELGGHVGALGFGVPLNVKLTCRPDVLFEVQCTDHNLCLGGIPWHYIMSKPGNRGIFNVFTVATKEQVRNGRLEMTGISVEPDKCFFHADDSGRILHIGAEEVRVMKLCEDRQDSSSNGPSYLLKEQFSVKPVKPASQSFNPEAIGFTSSGRKVKIRSYSDDSVECKYESIQTVDYENELELLVVTSVFSGDDSYQGLVHLHDNHTGALMQQIQLEEPWTEFCDHMVILDMDTLIHIVKAPRRNFQCTVYRLDRSDSSDYPASDVIRKSRKRSHLQGRHSRSSGDFPDVT